MNRNKKIRSPYLVLLAVSLGMIMTVLDTTILNVAIAKLQVAMGQSTDAVQWVITAYMLVVAVMLSAAGWLSDHFGTKRVFLTALALFTLGSFLCSISGNLLMLIISRIIQGIGGGLLPPVAMAILTEVFPREKLGMVMALFSIPAIASTSFGPSLGGWLIDHFSWRAMFDINIPVGIAALVLCSAMLSERGKESKSPFDFPAFAAIGVGMGALLFALSNGNADWNTDGWTSPVMMVCYVASLTGFSLFSIFQRTTHHPLIDFSLFRSFNFTLASMLLFIFGLGVFGSDFLLPLYLQTGLGYTPTQAGTIFLPFGLVMIAAGILGGKLTDRMGPKPPGLAGLLVRAYGMYRFTFLTAYSPRHDITVTICFLGAGMGLLMSPLQTAALSAIPASKSAQASGLIQIFRQLGGSFGVAILSSLLLQRTKFHMADFSQAMNSYRPVFQDSLTRIYHHALNVSGGSSADALSRAESMISLNVQKIAFVRSIDDVFFAAGLISLLSSIPFLFLRTSGIAGKGKNQIPEPV